MARRINRDINEKALWKQYRFYGFMIWLSVMMGNFRIPGWSKIWKKYCQKKHEIEKELKLY